MKQSEVDTETKESESGEKNSSIQLGISEGQKKLYMTRSRILDKRVVQPKETVQSGNFLTAKHSSPDASRYVFLFFLFLFLFFFLFLFSVSFLLFFFTDRLLAKRLVAGLDVRLLCFFLDLITRNQANEDMITGVRMMRTSLLLYHFLLSTMLLLKTSPMK